MKLWDLFSRPEDDSPSPSSWWEQELIWLDQLLPQGQKGPRQASNEDRQQAWERYWSHFHTLSPDRQKRAAYVLAQRGCSGGTSGFHTGLSSVPYPFRFCGWADCGDRFQPGGVAFRIERGCFPDGPVRLFYTADDNWPTYADVGHADSQALGLLEGVRQLSSGISNVHLAEKSLPGEKSPRVLVVFDLDASAIRPAVCLQDGCISTEKTGPYIFTLPRCGEFFCTLGELRDDRVIPLHKDDFCMK